MNLFDSGDNITIVRKSHESEKLPLRVVVTDATTYIGRSLAYRILIDKIFGPDEEIILSLFDTSDSAVFLESVAIEISASAPNVLKGVKNPSNAFLDADVIFSIGKAPDYNFIKSDFYSDRLFYDSVLATKNDAKAIDRYAKKNALVIALGNTAAKIISEYAPSIPKENITAVSLGLQNFTASLIAEKTERVPNNVKNLIIWGTNSRHVLPYCNYAKFSDGKSVIEEINDDTWFKKKLPKLLHGMFRKCNYRISEAVALIDHCKYLIQGTPEGEWISMIVCSDGSYDIEPGVFFSFPVYIKNKKWTIVKDLHIDDYCKEVNKDILVSINANVTAALTVCEQSLTFSVSRKSVRKSILKLA